MFASNPQKVNKIRMIEAGNYSPYRKSFLNFFTYNKYIRNPSTGLVTLATIAQKIVTDTLMYSESVSLIRYEDVYDADIIFFSVNTFNAVRSYEIADRLREKSNAVLVMGGMHASLNYPEAIQHCDYVLTGDADESITELIHALRNGQEIDFPGVVLWREEKVVFTGERRQPENIDTIPDRNLVHDYARMAKYYYTLWPQVHASRGCPHNCSYCTVIRHFGRKIRKRTPQNIVEDIRQAIEFHKKPFIPRFKSCVWITDDNFPQDREWAISVLKAIIESDIKYNFTVQARYEVGFDDEMLALMKQAGFMEVSIGVEFLDDDSYKEFNKDCNYRDLVSAIRNIHAHGIGVRGLFMVGAEKDQKGVGKKIAKFVRDNHIHGTLVQSLFFTPGTPFFEKNKHLLLHQDWDRYNGNVVHYPQNIKPYELQQEIIIASKKIYSPGRVLYALFRFKWMHMVSFIGECFWQYHVRKDLRKELENLKKLDAKYSSAHSVNKTER
ncbi:B12-binding domain-containing radical SAM protein [Christensenellaceae bacterium OttesenSCG-928-K19]|nr:B12-binding domain-containing radical SAM protein [Christensenellaceae bacterium OttesenSCG-928-K19]